ncbi:MAG TPA: 4a-hydroxytetrahydrobiopterin dehydratase [Patescibacteria group bacterium]|nr:4a-hydroxytetrahydrobiopterin dehydratase [Patescibacteria group bacterium]
MAVPESEQLLPEATLAKLLGELDGWQRDGQAITKTFTRKGWKSALAFVNKVGDAAAAADHHPDIHIEHYKTVRIVLTTHVTKGISRADIDLAAEIDRIATA